MYIKIYDKLRKMTFAKLQSSDIFTFRQILKHLICISGFPCVQYADQCAAFSIDRGTLDEALVSGCKRLQTDQAVCSGNK